MKKKKLENLSEVLNVFSVMDELVARLYKWPPNESVISHFKTINAREDDDLFSQDEDCLSGIKHLEEFCSNKEPVEAVRMATTDQNHLFVGPMHLPTPPWSSVYMDQGALFGPTAIKVEEEFKRFGFCIPKGEHEPSDHIAYELQFISEMSKKASMALQSSDEVEALKYLKEIKSFTETYLSPWVSKFVQLIKENAKTKFYYGLAELTVGLINLHTKILERLVKILNRSDAFL